MDALLRLASLNADYAATIDADRLEDWPDFFLDSCLYKITSADNVRRNLQAGIVFADSRGMLHDRVTALRRANIFERQAYRHIIGLPRILSESGPDTRSETPFLVVRTMRDGRSDLFATGIYQDRVRKDSDTLRFAERIVICDSQRFDTLLAIPL